MIWARGVRKREVSRMTPRLFWLKQVWEGTMILSSGIRRTRCEEKVGLALVIISLRGLRDNKMLSK